MDKKTSGNNADHSSNGKSNPVEEPVVEQQITDARHTAEEEIEEDPDFSTDPTDDLDEGELARKDNSND